MPQDGKLPGDEKTLSAVVFPRPLLKAALFRALLAYSAIPRAS